MLGEGGTTLSDLEDAARCFLQRGERGVDLKRYRALIDALEGDFAAEARHTQQTGAHLADGSATVVTWIGRLCAMSTSSAADRLCVGTQLEELPKIANALSTGEIGYQSVSLLCHLRDQLGDKRELFDEDEMLEHARNHSVVRLRLLCRIARHIADPDGFFNEAEADFSRRRLHVSMLSDGMHVIDGILDPVGGAALRTALDSLAKRLGPDDDRSHKQRMADSLVELATHAMDEGRLPRRHSVRPHVNVTTTLEGLKNQVTTTTPLEGLKNRAGAPAADVELSLPISTRTVERLACDCTISRVLLAGSMVIDVGR